MNNKIMYKKSENFEITETFEFEKLTEKMLLNCNGDKNKAAKLFLNPVILIGIPEEKIIGTEKQVRYAADLLFKKLSSLFCPELGRTADKILASVSTIPMDAGILIAKLNK